MPALPAASRIKEAAELFTFKLAALAPQLSRVREVPSMPSEHSQPGTPPAPISHHGKVDCLSDAVSSVEAIVVPPQCIGG